MAPQHGTRRGGHGVRQGGQITSASASAAIASSAGNSALTFSTARLLEDATSISKPRRQGSRWHGCRKACPTFSQRPLTENAFAGSSNAVMALARRVTVVATTSRSNVVLPVPGGPFTARMGEASLVTIARSTAACCNSTRPCLPGAGQRAGGMRFGASAAASAASSARRSCCWSAPRHRDTFEARGRLAGVKQRLRLREYRLRRNCSAASVRARRCS